MGLKVNWKPIKDAKKNGLVYFLSGWKKKRGGERWVDLGYWSDAHGGFVSQDLGDDLMKPTHFAEHYMPDPPTE